MGLNMKEQKMNTKRWIALSISMLAATAMIAACASSESAPQGGDQEVGISDLPPQGKTATEVGDGYDGEATAGNEVAGGVASSTDAPAPVATPPAQDPAPATGYKAGPKGKDTGGEYKRKTVIDFSDETIEGDLTSPDGEYVKSRKVSKKNEPMFQPPKTLGRDGRFDDDADVDEREAGERSHAPPPPAEPEMPEAEEESYRTETMSEPAADSGSSPGLFEKVGDALGGLFSGKKGKADKKPDVAKRPTPKKPKPTEADRRKAEEQRRNRIAQERARQEALRRQHAAQQEAQKQQRKIAEIRRKLASHKDDTDELWVITKDKTSKTRSSSDDGYGSGTLLAHLESGAQGQKQIPLPLKHTDVKASINGYIGTTLVTQKYRNPYDQVIEAVYVFPLPENAAVSEFVMQIGERRIRGIVRERQEAEQIYREAKRQGYTAALLTQERPNIFTQKVANIEPQNEIDIELTYFNTLPYRDGAYVFSFPMVVGPRFNPPGWKDGIGAVGEKAIGTSGQKTEIPYLKPSEDSAHRLSLSVDIDAQMPIEEIHSVAHKIDKRFISDAKRQVTLLHDKVVPNKDFILRIHLAGERIKSGLVAHKGKNGTTFTMMLEPPKALEYAERAPMELIFVLDCSGSMNGVPLEKAKRAVRNVMARLGPDDTFQIIRFSNNASQLGRKPLPATVSNKRKGLRYLNSLNGTGGTMMIEGIKAALDFPHDDRRFRLVSFMTDGYIGNENQILAAIKQKLGASRIFSFGVGSSPNRHLLEEMAKVGKGAVAYVTLNDNDSDRQVDAFYRRISHPALADIQIDWASIGATDVYPREIPDLFVGRPVVVTGRFIEGLPTSIPVTGRIGGEKTRIQIPISNRSIGDVPALPRIWARMKIRDLSDQALLAPNPLELAEEIKVTALNYGIMSAFTAFIAVDASRKVRGGGDGATVNVPVHMPEGVKYDTTVKEGT
jgi:Ca-activated chloride channel family protein